jgi:hypothetical protein
MGVGLGCGVEVCVGCGEFVGVSVPVAVAVIVDVAVGGIIASGACRSAKYTIMAPIPRKIANNPIAIGKLNVMDGIRLPSTTFEDWDVLSTLINSAPQTRQRVAFSFTLEPHVGQIFVGEVLISGVILYLKAGFTRLGALYQLFQPARN